MIEFLTYPAFVIVTAVVALLINRLLCKDNDNEYSISYEYMPFNLVRDHNGDIKQSSWEELKTLGADGWEIAFNIDESYKSYFLILKRETFHQS